MNSYSRTWAEMEALSIMYRYRGSASTDPAEPGRLLAKFMSIADRIKDERAVATMNLATEAAMGTRE